MFNAQTAQFTKYHVTDPGVFYQGNDVWASRPPRTPAARATRRSSASRPTTSRCESPARQTPSSCCCSRWSLQGRKNMIAWVAAHNDPGNYGQVSVFDFPSNSNVFGPSRWSR
jgi:uncharacterized membrane protein (UPF0182 family)